MKNFQILSLLLLVSVCFQVHPLAADVCVFERVAVAAAQATYDAARADFLEIQAKVRVLQTKMKFGSSQTWYTDALELAQTEQDLLAQAAVCDGTYISLQYLVSDLVACEVSAHRCSGCNTLIERAGMSGHRSLLCAANHVYYECISVWHHTTYTTCPIGGETLLMCQLASHSHKVLCSGCGDLYDAMSSYEDYHRWRTCTQRTDYFRLSAPSYLHTYCGASFRECDNPISSCSGVRAGLPHSD